MISTLYFTDDDTPFPDVEQAETDPDGLLTVGGQLSSKRLLMAYKQGIFPWYNDDQSPILWWSPNPRLVLYPSALKISKSLRKTLKKGHFEVRFDSAFLETLQACSQPRDDQEGTWITNNMIRAYSHLHQLGHAHSVESWYEGQLVGGLYGIGMGQIFFGESMFRTMSDASKVALVGLAQLLKANNYHFIDCQVKTDHLLSLGACEIPRPEFSRCLKQYTCEQGLEVSSWNIYSND